MSDPKQCDNHTDMCAEIRTNGTVLGRLDDSVKLLFKMFGGLNATINGNKEELKEAIADLKLCIVEKDAARQRKVFITILKYTGKVFKALIYIIVGLAASTILTSDSKTVAEAINQILFRIF